MRRNEHSEWGVLRGQGKLMVGDVVVAVVVDVFVVAVVVVVVGEGKH